MAEVFQTIREQDSDEPAGLLIEYATAVLGNTRMYGRIARDLQSARLDEGLVGSAEDLAQDLLLSLCVMSPQRLSSIDSLGAYAQRAFTNKIIDLKRRPAVKLRDGRELTIGLADAHHGTQSAENTALDLSSAFGPELTTAIDRLTPRQRAVLTLQYRDGLSEAQIAEKLGISPGAVKSNGSRARGALRDALNDPAIGSEDLR